MSEENPADYGEPKTQGPMKGIPEKALKKDIKAGKVVTGDDTKLSTETPDPNVAAAGGLGDTLTPTDSPVTTTSTGTTRSTT